MRDRGSGSAGPIPGGPHRPEGTPPPPLAAGTLSLRLSRHRLTARVWGASHETGGAPRMHRLPRILAGILWLASGALAALAGGGAALRPLADPGGLEQPVAALVEFLAALAGGALLGGPVARRVLLRARLSLERGGERAPFGALAAVLPPIVAAAGALVLTDRRAQVAVDGGLDAALLLAALGVALLAGSFTWLAPRPERAAPPAAPGPPPPIGLLWIDSGEPREATLRAAWRHARRRLAPLVRGPWRPLLAPLRGLVAAIRLGPVARATWSAHGGPATRASRALLVALSEQLGPRWRVARASRLEPREIGRALRALARAGCREICILGGEPLLTHRELRRLERRLLRALARRGSPHAVALRLDLADLVAFERAVERRAREAAAASPCDHLVLVVPRRPELDGDERTARRERLLARLSEALAKTAPVCSTADLDVLWRGGGPGVGLRARLADLARRQRAVLLVPTGHAVADLEWCAPAHDGTLDRFLRHGGRSLARAEPPGDDSRWIADLAGEVRALVEREPAANGERADRPASATTDRVR